MKQHEAKQFLPIIQAWADGKTIQWRETPTSGQWHDYLSVGLCNFSGSADEYRIKPEPKLRPWKPDEVPFGALIRVKASKVWHLIVGVCGDMGDLRAGHAFSGSLTWCLFQAEHSIDGGKTWLPCGVMEDAQ